mmetsp:Transcript_5854/g.12919  ORF Transcript_5854/g.12919 Transcript_5854/m.12919 type:complete len:99 (+) Transcript_5854:713-1009(+)
MNWLSLTVPISRSQTNMLSVCYHFVFDGICKKDALALINCGRPMPFHFICNTKYHQSLVEGAREPVSEHGVGTLLSFKINQTATVASIKEANNKIVFQ